MLRNSLQPLRKVELSSTFSSATVSVTGLAMFLTVARYVTLGNDSCNLSRNDFSRQVAQKIAQCNSAFRLIYNRLILSLVLISDLKVQMRSVKMLTFSCSGILFQIILVDFSVQFGLQRRHRWDLPITSIRKVVWLLRGGVF